MCREATGPDCPGVRIRCRLDGPLIVEGSVEVVDHHGHPFPVPTMQVLRAEVAQALAAGEGGPTFYCEDATGTTG